MTKNLGFTLIEISLTTALLGVVAAITAAFWINIQRSYEFSLTGFQVTDHASQVARQITSELRQAEEAMNGAYPLAVLEDNQLAFYTDIDHNESVERRRYFLEGTTLKRGVLQPSGNPPSYDPGGEVVTTVVEKIDSTQLPLFYYYNSDWPGDQVNNPLGYWQRPLETRLVKVVVPIVISDSIGSHAFQTESMVMIRNLKHY